MAALHEKKRPFFEKAALFTVEVEQKKGKKSGAGMVLTTTGIILTAAHILGNEKMAIVRRCRITDKSWNNKTVECFGRYLGDVIYTNKKLDIAIIKLRQPPPLTIAKFRLNGRVELSQELFRIGRDMGNECLAEGHVYDIFDTDGEFRVSMRGPPGSSGSPIFDEEGWVVGMARAGNANPKDVPFSSCIPIATVWQAIKDQPFMRNPRL